MRAEVEHMKKIIRWTTVCGQCGRECRTAMCRRCRQSACRDDARLRQLRPMRKSANALAGGLILAMALSLPSAASAQNSGRPAAAAPEGGLYLTAFRSPATGLEYRMDRVAIHAGYYPTILETDGQAKGENTNFIRTGASFYLRPTGWTPYVTPSIVLSLDDDWDNGVLTELGVRFPLSSRASLRGGVGVLRTFDGETRVNPTVGLDIRLGNR
jgi:hypothetical protein